MGFSFDLHPLQHLITGLGACLVVTLVAADRSTDMSAPPTFGSMFHGNMAVLQRGVEVQVFGTGPANARLMLTTPSKAVEHVVVDSQGRWSYLLPPQPTSWNQHMEIRVATSTAAVTNPTAANADQVTVSFGETVLCRYPHFFTHMHNFMVCH